MFSLKFTSYCYFTQQHIISYTYYSRPFISWVMNMCDQEKERDSLLPWPRIEYWNNRLFEISESTQWTIKLNNINIKQDCDMET